MKKNNSKLIFASAFGILVSLGVGFLSGIVTQNAIPTWYADLKKPFFSPPNWIFAPIWILLYTLMGLAAGRVWFYGKVLLLKKKALYYFAIQLILNGLWPLMFFGFRNPLLALINIIILWILIQRCIFLFQHIDRKASLMLYPYLIWVTFATFLNGSIIYLN